MSDWLLNSTWSCLTWGRELMQTKAFRVESVILISLRQHCVWKLYLIYLNNTTGTPFLIKKSDWSYWNSDPIKNGHKHYRCPIKSVAVHTLAILAVNWNYFEDFMWFTKHNAAHFAFIFVVDILYNTNDELFALNSQRAFWSNIHLSFKIQYNRIDQYLSGHKSIPNFSSIFPK